MLEALSLEVGLAVVEQLVVPVVSDVPDDPHVGQGELLHLDEFHPLL